ncbi:MAG: ATP-dependent Zn protease [Cyanobacteria bacterium J083]|nr:MAG: ATP-dependent Zn protease [Cyanobacteria bacterium J083]
MRQTSLNLIAIAIFTITISCLLGPIINLSPTIPASITFVLMGLVTIDTLSFRNQGANILLDLLATKAQKERIIKHEAGHFLAAYFLGIPIESYTLSAWEALKKGQSGMGGVVFAAESINQALTSREASLALERFSTVLMAGIAAETIFYGEAEGGEEDLVQLKQIFDLVGLSPNLYRQKQRWAKLQAQNLIQKHQSSYEALVAAMTARKPIEECLSIIQANT